MTISFEDWMTPWAVPMPSHGLPNPVEVAALESRIGWLSPVDQDVLDLLRRGLPQEQIGAILRGRTQGTISSRVSRALARLRACCELEDVPLAQVIEDIQAALPSGQVKADRAEVAGLWTFCRGGQLVARHLGMGQRSVSEAVLKVGQAITCHLDQGGELTPGLRYFLTVQANPALTGRHWHGRVGHSNSGWTGYARGPFQRYWPDPMLIVE